MIKNIRLRIQKYKRREFLPSSIFYIPIFIYFLYLAIRAKHLGFFTNVNPNITLSGAIGYGKEEDLDKFDPKYLPITIVVAKGHDCEYIEKQMKQQGIVYPCIAKPTLGMKGRDVKKIHNTKQMKTYLKHVHEDILIQEYINYPLEFGIFYYRMPNEVYGHITGIVEKKFMYLQGDGKHTFEELVIHHPRAKYYYHQFKKKYPNMRGTILENGKKFQLNYVGNHCRGSVFYDVSYLTTPELESIIDTITKKIPNFYFGRYDIKARTIEDLQKGNFKIIELNGMGSVPTHMYDPKYTIRKAYKILFQHWKITYRISKQNKENGHPYVPVKEILKIVKQYKNKQHISI